MQTLDEVGSADAEASLDVLDGQIDLWLGNRQVRLSAGMSAVLPAGVPHGFCSVAGQEHRLLVVVNPRRGAHAFGEHDHHRTGTAAAVTTADPRALCTV